MIINENSQEACMDVTYQYPWVGRPIDAIDIHTVNFLYSQSPGHSIVESSAILSTLTSDHSGEYRRETLATASIYSCGP